VFRFVLVLLVNPGLCRHVIALQPTLLESSHAAVTDAQRANIKPRAQTMLAVKDTKPFRSTLNSSKLNQPQQLS